MSITRRSFIKGSSALCAAQALSLTSCKKNLPDTTRASTQDILSSGFAEIQQLYTNIGQLRRTVCMTHSSVCRGSAVLLDEQGVLAIAAHELSSYEKFVRLEFYPDAKQGACHAYAQVVQIDRPTDSAFLLLVDPRDIERYQLQPIRAWDTFDNDKHKVGETFIGIGYPNDPQGHAVLHAGILNLDRFIASAYVHNDLNRNGIGDGQEVYCQIQALNKADNTVPDGMSGGGIFSTNGDYLGILSAANDTSTSFTPVDAVRKAYLKLKGYSVAPLRANECNIPVDAPKLKL